jgi:predicted aspartyl protease
VAKKKLPSVYQYDSVNFNPPAPVLNISLSTPIPQGAILKIPALLDSGADITVIPQVIAQHLQLKYVDEIPVTSYDGIVKKQFVYSAKIIFENLGDFIIRVITSDESFALIGRDVLNKWSVYLKGRNKIFEIS